MNRILVKISIALLCMPSAGWGQSALMEKDGPIVMGGLWEVNLETTEYGPRYEGGPVVERRTAFREERCLAAGPVASGRSWLRTSDGRAFASVGFAEGSPNSITTIYSGDFNSRFVELDTSYSYPLGVVQFGFRETLGHMRASYVRRGDCPPDMKPGERRRRSTE